MSLAANESQWSWRLAALAWVLQRGGEKKRLRIIARETDIQVEGRERVPGKDRGRVTDIQVVFPSNILESVLCVIILAVAVLYPVKMVP